MDNQVIQSLWFGAPLSVMERLCVRSFLTNGHEFHLYTYGNLEGVPEGTTIKDANEILPEAKIKQFRCIQQFADFFRNMLLLKLGGWWVDMDIVCLKPFDFQTPYVFYRDFEESTITSIVIKCPAGSPIMEHCCDIVNKMSQNQLDHLCYQDIGSYLIYPAVKKFNLMHFAPSGITFDPICWFNCWRVVDPNKQWDLRQSYALHLFHAAWNEGHEAWAIHKCMPNRKSPNTDDKFPDSCLYEQLKKRYL